MNLTRLFVFYNLPPPPLSLHISLGSGVTKGLIVLGARGNNLGTLRESWIPQYIFSEIAVADPGQVPPPPNSPRFRPQTEARRAAKSFLRPGDRLISGSG